MTAKAPPGQSPRTVVVTGGSTHIGRAIAEAHARQGDTVFVASRDLERCKAVAEAIREVGICHAVRCDVTDPHSVAELVKAAWSAEGRLDVMVCNAGGSRTVDPFPSTEATQIEETLRLNLVGSLLCAQEVAPRMIDSGRGVIILMASIFGILSSDPKLYDHVEDFIPTGPAYHAAKGGVIQLTRSLAAQLGPYGVRVNCVSPGVVPKDGTPGPLTDRFIARTPLRRLGSPEDVARSVTFLTGDDAAWITGHNLVVDGGWTSQ